ncbi:MAG: hypothetical protein J6L69_03125 [Lachnospiraceae bacterium]|nr:hypothetical protein [Lachnospiraceae bacterium]
MKSRYNRIYVHEEPLWCDEIPVIIEAYALLEDIKESEIIAQIKFRNVHERLSAIFVNIETFDISGEKISEISYQYLDLDVDNNELFGSQNAIELKNNYVRNINISVEKVVFSDGRIWTSNGNKWNKLQKLDTYFEDSSNVKLYKSLFGNNKKYVPAKCQNQWICSCGYVNLIDKTNCQECQCDLEILTQGLDVEWLKVETEYRIACNKAMSNNINELEKAIQIFESSDYKDSAKMLVKCQEKIKTINNQNIERAKKEKEIEERKRKRLLFISMALVAVLIFGVISVKYVIPNVKKHNMYKKATSYLNDEKYEEAIEMFRELGDYKDAESMINESKYLQAASCLKKKAWDKASSLYRKLDDYKDSKVMLNEVKYQEAKYCFESKDYIRAYMLFNTVSEYKDSEDMAKECKYQEAKGYYEIGGINYINMAINTYSVIEGYKDVNSLLADAYYEVSMLLIKAKQFDNIGDNINKINKYSPNDERILEIKKNVYDSATQLIIDKKFDIAITALNQIRDYEDAEKLIDDCYYYKSKSEYDVGNVKETLDYMKKIKTPSNYSDYGVIKKICQDTLEYSELYNKIKAKKGVFDQDDVSYLKELTNECMTIKCHASHDKSSELKKLLYVLDTYGPYVGRYEWISSDDPQTNKAGGFSSDVEVIIYNHSYGIYCGVSGLSSSEEVDDGNIAGENYIFVNEKTMKCKFNSSWNVYKRKA